MHTVGWREWVTLPELGIPGIKAKVDTGAKTSSLHAFEVSTEEDNGTEFVLFRLHPVRKKKHIILDCRTPVIDRRVVRDSGGHAEERIVIRSRLTFGPFDLTTEFTLTSRDDMMFPMLLGRRTIARVPMMVDVTRSYIHGKAQTRRYERLLASAK
ncbi:MAG: RimK/LysX family protein [Proteobacteria bacterium]|nr:RimK/LysX family protein [Pseudomonadota bacterium]MDA1300974.1 RimK/LysX family protein [Pseudomonadota bacterium]